MSFHLDLKLSMESELNEFQLKRICVKKLVKFEDFDSSKSEERIGKVEWRGVEGEEEAVHRLAFQLPPHHLIGTLD